MDKLRKKGGRPSAGGERRIGRQVFFSPAELARLQQRAAEARQPVGRYVRLAALRYRLVVIPEVNQVAWTQLARTASNLNQVSAAINRGRVKVVGPRLEDLLEQLAQAVADLRNCLIGVTLISEEAAE